MIAWTSSQLSCNCSATAFWLACFSHVIARASKSAVKRLPGSAQDSFTTRTPCSGHCKRGRSEEHTSELQSRLHLVCRLLLEKKKTTQQSTRTLSAARS